MIQNLFFFGNNFGKNKGAVVKGQQEKGQLTKGRPTFCRSTNKRDKWLTMTKGISTGISYLNLVSEWLWLL